MAYDDRPAGLYARLMLGVMSGFVHRLLSDRLLLVLLGGLLPLLLVTDLPVMQTAHLVQWPTLAALGGLMVLSRGLEDSGYLTRAGAMLLARWSGERSLAVALVVFAAILAAVVTNDVALFIVVPLTVGLRGVARVPVGRLIVFEALAVNAGSAISPVGNPQNLLLWQSTGVGFDAFITAMAPLALGLIIVLLALVPVAFPRQRLTIAGGTSAPPMDRHLLVVSLVCYPIFLLLTEFGLTLPATGLLALVFAVRFPAVLGRIDWSLLIVFVLMFVDLGLVARLPLIQHYTVGLATLPGGMLGASVILSQLISNLPATIFLLDFTDQWPTLAWGVSVGGFGLAIGSLANLIALRLAREPGLWRDFHRWSLLMLALGCGLAVVLRAL
ncbi:MAG: SLC13 family permease [Marinobacter sp.]|nr:SLC13 family permease [Marinobacter sp.]